MFSGIVEESFIVASLEAGRLAIACQNNSQLDLTDLRLGDSIAIDGVCLTVAKLSGSKLNLRIEFDLAQETQEKTALMQLKPDDLVHFERALKLTDRLNGHFVTGHVDGVTRLKSRVEQNNSIKLEFELPNMASALVVSKGSVALAGVSLTVGEVSKDSFYVYIVPHTSQVTRLTQLKVGARVNIEYDMLARYVAAQISASLTSSPVSSSLD